MFPDDIWHCIIYYLCHNRLYSYDMIQLLLTAKSFNATLFAYYYKLGYSDRYHVFKLLSNACSKLPEYEKLYQLYHYDIYFNMDVNPRFLCFALLEYSYSKTIKIFSNQDITYINKSTSYRHVLDLLCLHKKSFNWYINTYGNKKLPIPKKYINVGEFVICMYNILNHTINNKKRIKLQAVIHHNYNNNGYKFRISEFEV